MISKAVWNWLMKADHDDIEELCNLIADLEKMKQEKLRLALKYGIPLE